MSSYFIKCISLCVVFIFIFSLFTFSVKALQHDIEYGSDMNYHWISNEHYTFKIRKVDLGVVVEDGSYSGAEADFKDYITGYTYLAVFENYTTSNNTAFGNFIITCYFEELFVYINITGWLGNTTQENTNQRLNISYRFDNSPIVDVKTTLELWGNNKLAFIQIYHGAPIRNDIITQKLNVKLAKFDSGVGLRLAPTMGKNDFYVRSSNYTSYFDKEPSYHDICYGLKMLYFGRPATFTHTTQSSIISLLDYKYTQDGSIALWIGDENAKYNITDETFYTHYQLFFPHNDETIYERYDWLVGRITRINKFGTPAPYMSSLCIEVDVDYFSPEKVEYANNYFASIGLKPTVSVWFGTPPGGEGEVDDWIGDNSKYLRENDTYKNATFPLIAAEDIGFAVHSITSGNDTRESYIENITWLNTKMSYQEYKVYIQHGSYEKNQENPRYTLDDDIHNIADLLVDNGITYNSLGASIYAESTGLNVEFSGTSAGTSPVIRNGVREWIRTSVPTYANFIDRVTSTNLDYLNEVNGLAILYSHLFAGGFWDGLEFNIPTKTVLNLIKSYDKSYSIFLDTAENVIGYYSAIQKTDWEIYYNKSGFPISVQITGGVDENVTYCQLSSHENYLVNKYGYNIRVIGNLFDEYYTQLVSDYMYYDYIHYTETNLLPYYAYIKITDLNQKLLDYTFKAPEGFITDFIFKSSFWSLLFLVIIFLPAIVINFFIPRFGLIIGLGGTATILMFSGFIPVSYFTIMIIGVGIYLYRGEEW